MTPTGRRGGGGVCSCVVVVAVKLRARLRTGAAAERRREGLDKKEKSGLEPEQDVKQEEYYQEFINNRDAWFKLFLFGFIQE